MSDHPDREQIHRELDTDAEEPATQVAEIIADIEDTDTTTLPTMYSCVDGVLDHLFSNPPAPEAQMKVEFSYEAYRITVEQGGDATFVRTE
jgi:hypothetical protein